MGKFDLISYDFSGLVDLATGLDEKVTEKAVRNTLNVTIRRANKAVKANIKKKYFLTKNFLSAKDPKVKILTARTGSLTVGVFVVAVGRGLFVWQARDTKTGVKAQIKRGQTDIRLHARIFWGAKGGKFPVVGIDNKYVKKKNPKGRHQWLYGPNRATLYRSRENLKIFNDAFADKEFQKTLDEKFNDQFEKIKFK
jgi:hypothetical protein